jgi:hypothetical protein
VQEWYFELASKKNAKADKKLKETYDLLFSFVNIKKTTFTP